MATPMANAEVKTPQATTLTQQFVDAGLVIDRLQVFEIGGIVLIRGRAADKAQAAEAGRVALNLGYERVANLIQVIETPDDVKIEQIAQRELTLHRALDGCKFRIDSEKGVLSVNGEVQHELQKDVAMQLLRTIDGVRELRAELVRQ